MVGLIGVVYLMLTYLASRNRQVRRRLIPVVGACAAVVALWVFAPELLSTGDMGLTLKIRQAGLVIGGVAVAGRYVSIRPTGREKAARIAGVVSTPLLCLCLAVSSGNWLVAIAAAVLAATTSIRPAGGSPAEDPQQAPPPPDTEQ